MLQLPVFLLQSCRFVQWRTWIFLFSLNNVNYLWANTVYVYFDVPIAFGKNANCYFENEYGKGQSRVPPWQICQKLGKRGEKQGKIREKGKLGRKGKNREGSFTLLLLTERPGYATVNYEFVLCNIQVSIYVLKFNQDEFKAGLCLCFCFCIVTPIRNSAEQTSCISLSCQTNNRDWNILHLG